MRDDSRPQAESVNGLVALSTHVLAPRLSEMLEVGCLEHSIARTRKRFEPPAIENGKVAANVADQALSL